jgi:hypothetical protein
MGRPSDCNCFCGGGIVQPIDPPPLSQYGNCDCLFGGHTFWDSFSYGYLFLRRFFSSQAVDTLITDSPYGFIVIQVCNYNSGTDDAFTVFLNNSQIDSYLDLGQDARVGKIYKGWDNAWGSAPVIDDDDPLLLCQGENHTQVTFDVDLTLNGRNTLTASQAQDNNQGNFGYIRIIFYRYPYTRGNGCVIVDWEYQDAPLWNYYFDFSDVVYEFNYYPEDKDGDELNPYIISYGTKVKYSDSPIVDLGCNGTKLIDDFYTSTVHLEDEDVPDPDRYDLKVVSFTATLPPSTCQEGTIIYGTWWVRPYRGPSKDQWVDTGVDADNELILDEDVLSYVEFSGDLDQGESNKMDIYPQIYCLEKATPPGL